MVIPSKVCGAGIRVDSAVVQFPVSDFLLVPLRQLAYLKFFKPVPRCLAGSGSKRELGKE